MNNSTGKGKIEIQQSEDKYQRLHNAIDDLDGRLKSFSIIYERFLRKYGTIKDKVNVLQDKLQTRNDRVLKLVNKPAPTPNYNANSNTDDMDNEPVKEDEQDDVDKDEQPGTRIPHAISNINRDFSRTKILYGINKKARLEEIAVVKNEKTTTDMSINVWNTHRPSLIEDLMSIRKEKFADDVLCVAISHKCANGIMPFQATGHYKKFIVIVPIEMKMNEYTSYMNPCNKKMPFELELSLPEKSINIVDLIGEYTIKSDSVMALECADGLPTLIKERGHTHSGEIYTIITVDSKKQRFNSCRMISEVSSPAGRNHLMLKMASADTVGLTFNIYRINKEFCTPHIEAIHDTLGQVELASMKPNLGSVTIPARKHLPKQLISLYNAFIKGMKQSLTSDYRVNFSLIIGKSGCGRKGMKPTSDPHNEIRFVWDGTIDRFQSSTHRFTEEASCVENVDVQNLEDISSTKSVCDEVSLGVSLVHPFKETKMIKKNIAKEVEIIIRKENTVNERKMIKTKRTPVNERGVVLTKEHFVNGRKMIKTKEDPTNKRNIVTTNENAVNERKMVTTKEIPVNERGMVATEENHVIDRNMVTTKEKPVNRRNIVTIKEKLATEREMATTKENHVNENENITTEKLVKEREKATSKENIFNEKENITKEKIVNEREMAATKDNIANNREKKATKESKAYITKHGQVLPLKALCKKIVDILNQTTKTTKTIIKESPMQSRDTSTDKTTIKEHEAYNRVGNRGDLGKIIDSSIIDEHPESAINENSFGSDRSRLSGLRNEGSSVVRVKPELRHELMKLAKPSSQLPDILEDPMKEYQFSSKSRHMPSLKDLMNKGFLFDDSHAKFLSINMLNILTFLRDRCIIHADICPGKVVFNDKGYPSLTGYERSEIIGSPLRRGHPLIPRLEYCSPEQFLKEHHVTEATDVFSMGVLVYTMVYGRSPHKGTNYRETKANLQSDDFTPSFVPDGKLSAEGEQFIVHCIRRKPEKRFSLKEGKSSLIGSVKWFNNLEEVQLANQTYMSPFLQLMARTNKRS